MTSPHILQVFTDSAGNFGDAASVVADEGQRISDADRQELARQLATGETAFINDMATASISIIHPPGEIDFAGVAAIAAAWLIAKLRGEPVESMRGRGGDIYVRQVGELIWVRADLATMPPWHHQQLENPEAIERLRADDLKTTEHTMFWAWLDEAKGVMRARTFAADWDIPEAEGNGSGSMLLAASLGRELEIHHGQGSVIFAKVAGENQAEIGGQVFEGAGKRVAL